MPTAYADQFAENEVSYSQVASWLSCRQQYAYRFSEGLEPLAAERRLSRGDAVHYGLALGILKGPRYIRPAVEVWKRDQLSALDSLPDEIWREASETVNRSAAEAELIANRAYEDFGSRWETVHGPDGSALVELSLSMEIWTPVGAMKMVGTVDWVARDTRTGLVWLWDHKTREQFQPDNSEEVNLQNAIYQYMLLAYGVETVGSVTNQIDANPPTMPRVLRNGSVSRARIKCDWKTYAEFCRSVGQDPREYEAEMLPKLDAVFRRPIVAYRSPEQLRRIWNLIVVPVVQEIAQYRSNPAGPDQVANAPTWPIVRNLNHRACNGCSVRDVCLAELSGTDADYIRRTRYTSREQRRATA